jgi:selenide,water dikinase
LKFCDIKTMAALNRAAAEAMCAVGIGPDAAVHAATDITGFGLLGHALNVARESRVTLELRSEALPLLAGALDHAERYQAGGLKANRRQFEPSVEWRRKPSPALEALLFDPQTSGGLFLLVPPEESAALVASLEGAAIVGIVREQGPQPLVVL